MRKLFIAVIVSLGVCAQALAAAPAGTWKGTVGFVGEGAHDYRPSARLAVMSAGATATFAGRSGATHITAATSCVIRYQHVREDGTWSYYRQRGAITYGPHGYVANAPCLFSGGNTLRVTKVTPTRIRADFAQGTDFNGNTSEAFRAYLSRAS